MTITLNDKLLHYIDSLLETGFYGRTRPECVKRLVEDQIWALLQEGFKPSYKNKKESQ